MEITFELTEADLHEVQRHRAVRRRKWVQSRPFIAALTVLVGALLWPMGRAMGLGPAPYGFAVLVAGIILLVWLPSRRGLRLRALEGWALRRATSRAVAASVLGRVTIVVTDTQVKRIREGAEALELSPRDIAWLTVSATVLVLHLSRKRVLVIPRRAFASDAEALQLQQRVEQLCGQQAQRLDADA